MSAMLRIETLGRCAAVVGERRIEPNAAMVFAALLLLGLEPSHRWSRAEMAALLWPEAANSTRAARLRWLLTRLRSIGLPLENNSPQISLRAADVRVDVEDIDRIAPECIAQLLPEFASGSSSALATWVDDRRTALSAVVSRRLVVRLRASIADSDWPLTVALAEAIQRVEASNEDAAFALANALCRLGRRVQAIIGLEHYLTDLEGEAGEARVNAQALLARIRSVGRDERPPEPRFVGRRDELQRIDELLRSARQGQGVALVLAGPAGIGKTRLLEEAAVRATIARMQVVRVRCQRGTAIRSLSGIVELIPQLLELRGAVGCDPDNLNRLRRLAQIETSNSADQASADFRRARLVAALLDLLDAVSSEAALLVEVDDFQWADPSLRWLWDRLVAWSAGHPVSWLFAQRPTRRNQISIDATSVSVGSLDQHSASELLDDLAARVNRRLDAFSRDALMARGSGSPLFLRELTRQWGTTGHCEKLPGSLLTIFDAGLGSLNRYALRTLQVAAVLDTHATLERIECVAELPRSAFLDAILDLEAAGILSADDRGKTSGHVLWAEAALSRLSRNVARIIHRHAAERLEQETSLDPSLPLLWECARHWEQAGRPGKARACLVQGAEHLVANGFVDDAADAYESIVQRTEDPVKYLDLTRRWADLLYTCGRNTEVLGAVRQHEKLAREILPAYEEHNEMELLAARARYVQSGDVVAQMLESLDCVQASNASNAHRLRAAKECVRASSLVSTSTLRDVVEVARRIPRRTDDEMWDGEMIEHTYYLRFGDARASLQAGERLVLLAGKDDVRRAYALTACAISQFVIGPLSEAKKTATEVIRFAQRMGLSGPLRDAYVQLLYVSLEVDPPPVTRKIIERSRKAIEALLDGAGPYSNWTFASYEAQLAAVEGNLPEALRLAVPIDQCLKTVPPRWRVGLLAIHLSVALQRGEMEEAAEIAAHMAPCFGEADYSLDWAATQYGDFLSRINPEEAIRFARRYVREIRRELFPAPPALLALASKRQRSTTLALA